MTTFNIVDQPWLLVSFQDGVDTVSLRDVFHRASEIEDIQIDFHAERQAVSNFLSAVFYRVLTTWDDDLSYREAVYALLDGDIDLGEAFDRYVSRDVGGEPLIERFDLFHEVHPFLQVPGWKRSNGAYDPSAMFSEVPTPTSGVPGGGYWSNRASQVQSPRVSRLSFSEAVVPLIWAQQGWCSKRGSAVYDDGSPIHPYKGKAGEFFLSSGTDGTMFLVPFLSVVGKDLQSTMLLSSPSIEDFDGWTMQDDTAYWELSSDEKSFYGRLSAGARGPADILTFPRSAVLLETDGEAVTGVHLSPNNTVVVADVLDMVRNGHGWVPDKVRDAVLEFSPEDSRGKIIEFFPDNAMSTQTHGHTKKSSSSYALFHPSAFMVKVTETNKKGEDEVKYACRVTPTGGVWEGVGTLVALGDRSPRIIQWVRQFVNYDEIIPEDGIVEIRYTHLESDQGNIVKIDSDTLYLGSALARGSFSSEEVPARISDGSGLILSVSRILGGLEGEIAVALGSNPTAGKSGIHIAGSFLERVQPKVESYIAGITSDAKPSDVSTFFGKIVREEATAAIDRALRLVPPSLIGATREDLKGNARNIARDSTSTKNVIKRMTEASE